MERLKQKQPSQLHVGVERFAVVLRSANAVAYHTGQRWTPTIFVRELIDRYGAQVEKELLIEAGKHNASTESPGD